MESRKLVLRDTDGRALGAIDVSALQNENAGAAYVISVETQCDLGQWHTGEAHALACWGPAISEPAQL